MYYQPGPDENTHVSRMGSDCGWFIDSMSTLQNGQYKEIQKDIANELLNTN